MTIFCQSLTISLKIHFLGVLYVCVCDVFMIMSKVWENADYELGDIRLMPPPPCLMKPMKY